jgi:enamine deaminase RidA (YjgF/YER057c/UK114 family)
MTKFLIALCVVLGVAAATTQCELNIAHFVANFRTLVDDVNAKNWAAVQEDIKIGYSFGFCLLKDCNAVKYDTPKIQECVREAKGLAVYLASAYDNVDDLFLVEAYTQSISLGNEDFVNKCINIDVSEMILFKLDAGKQIVAFAQNAQQCLAEITNNLPELKKLINDVKNFADIDTLKADLAALYQNFDAVAQKCGIPKPALPDVFANPTQCIQEVKTLVFDAANIIRNAGDFNKIKNAVADLIAQAPNVVAQCGVKIQ